MDDFFKRMKKEGLPVAITTEREEEYFTGFVRAVDEEFVLVESISTTGHSDGWSCIRGEEIARADAATKYLIMLAKVYERYGEHPTYLKIAAKDVLASFIDYAIKNKWLCTIELGFSETETLTGYFIERGFDSAQMSLMGANGVSDGFSTFDYEEIISISAQGGREKYLETVVEILEEESGKSKPKLLRSDGEEKKGKGKDEKTAHDGKDTGKEKGNEPPKDTKKHPKTAGEKENEKNGEKKNSRIISFPKKDK